MTKAAARLFSTALAVGPLLLAHSARAEESCSLRGEAIISKGVTISDPGGADIAQFTGAKVSISLSGFSTSGGSRAKIQTTGFRIEGSVRARDIPVYTARSVPAYAGHVWIAEGRRVSVIGAGPGKLHVEKSVTAPLSGTFHGWAPCESFSLAERVPSGWTPPGNARGYVLRRDRIDLYSSERGDVVTALERGGDGPGVLLWSTEGSTGSWVHVEHHGDIVLDGWVRTSDVSALPPGETMDQLAPSPIQRGSPILDVQGQPRIVRLDRSVSLRAAASDAAATIGGIESGVEVMVMDVVAGWASVLPKALNVMPAGSNQFWVRAKDLGL